MSKVKVSIFISLLVCFSFARDVVAQSRRKSTTRKSSASQGTLPRQQVLNNEARQLATTYWSKYLIKCGASSFLYSDDRLFEFRDKPRFGFIGQALSPRSLNRAEILNGVDPLPIEWDGTISVSFDLCRMNTSFYGEGQTFWHGWKKWSSNACGYSTKLSKVNGQWKLFELKQTSCDQLSKWGFTFIPQGVRGAVAERRATNDAATRAMLDDAPNIGIHMSQRPQFPMDWFRLIYQRAKNGELYKVKIFSNNDYGLFDRSSKSFDVGAHLWKLRDPILKQLQQNSTLVEMAFGPNNSWIAVATRNQDYYFKGENVPDSLLAALRKLQDSYGRIDGRSDVPWYIALGPDETWVMFYGRNRWACNCSQDIRNSLGTAASGYQLSQFIFAPNGEWLALYGQRYFDNSANFNKDIVDKLTELNKVGVDFNQVIFAPNGAWMIAGKPGRPYWLY